MSANSQNFREIGLTNIFLKEKSRIFALGSVFCGGGDGHGGRAKDKPNPTNYLEYLEHLEYREYLEYQGSFAIFAMFKTQSAQKVDVYRIELKLSWVRVLTDLISPNLGEVVVRANFRLGAQPGSRGSAHITLKVSSPTQFSLLIIGKENHKKKPDYDIILRKSISSRG